MSRAKLYKVSMTGSGPFGAETAAYNWKSGVPHFLVEGTRGNVWSGDAAGTPHTWQGVSSAAGWASRLEKRINGALQAAGHWDSHVVVSVAPIEPFRPGRQRRNPTAQFGKQVHLDRAAQLRREADDAEHRYRFESGDSRDKKHAEYLRGLAAQELQEAYVGVPMWDIDMDAAKKRVEGWGYKMQGGRYVKNPTSWKDGDRGVTPDGSYFVVASLHPSRAGADINARFVLSDGRQVYDGRGLPKLGWVDSRTARKVNPNKRSRR